MSVSVSVDIRPECIPTLPTFAFSFGLPAILPIPWPPTFNFNFSFTLKCPELFKDWMKNLDLKLGPFKLPIPRKLLDLDLTKYGAGAKTSATVDFSSFKSSHWDTKRVW